MLGDRAVPVARAVAAPPPSRSARACRRRVARARRRSSASSGSRSTSSGLHPRSKGRPGRRRRRSRRTCRRRSCAPSGRGPRPCRRSCTHSRGRRRLRRRRWRRSCGRRNAPPPGPGDEQLAAGRAVGDHVAGDDVAPRPRTATLGRAHDDPPARRAPCRGSRWRRRTGASRCPCGTKAPKLWPAEPRKVSSIVPSGRPAAAVAPGDLGAEHGADGAVDVADRPARLDRRRRCSSAGRHASMSCVVEGPLEAVVLGPDLAQRGGAVARRVRAEERREVEAGGLPVLDGAGRRRAVDAGRPPRRASGTRATASSSRTSSAMYSKNVSTNSGLPVNRLRSSGFWVAMPTGQVSRWQTRIITQPETTSGAVAKPNSSAPSSAAITTSRPVFSCPSTWTTIRSRRPFRTRVCWVSARPSSQGTPACLSEVSGAAPVPPSWPGDEDDVGVRLGHPGGDGADADLGDELHVDAGRGVGVLQVVDQLGEILDRVDVVVGRRRDQPDARASSTGSGRSTGRPCPRAAGRPRPAWRPGPS